MIVNKCLRILKKPLNIKLAKNLNFSTVINIDYNELKNPNINLKYKIDEAFNEDGLGLLTLSNFPGFKDSRKTLLPLAQKLANLEEKTLKKLEKPEFSYCLGWSHGKEIFNGRPDYLKGSFYAVPENDYFKMKNIEDGSTNITGMTPWPHEDISELELSFKNLGKIFLDAGCMLAKQIDSYIKNICPTYEQNQIHDHIKYSKRNVGRLLHYFPIKESDLNNDAMWCGWHNDHGTLTALTSAMYLDSQYREIFLKDSKSGLYAKNRKGEITKIRIPEDCIGFQIGETAQILSGGIVKATPHAVIIEDKPSDISRNTFAYFMEPKNEIKLEIPREKSIENITSFDPTGELCPIEQRFSNGMSFGDFEHRTINAYY